MFLQSNPDIFPKILYFLPKYGCFPEIFLHFPQNMFIFLKKSLEFLRNTALIFPGIDLNIAKIFREYLQTFSGVPESYSSAFLKFSAQFFSKVDGEEAEDKKSQSTFFVCLFVLFW